MKTFIAVIFLGILNYAYATKITVSQCNKQVDAMDGFDIGRWHTGTWYVTHVTKVTEPTECRTLSTSQDGGKSIVQHPFEGNQQLRCETTKEDGAQLTFDCKLGEKSLGETIFIPIATDYEDYSLYYLCITTDKGSTDDIYLVASRKSVNEEIPGALNSLTKDLSFKKCPN